MRRGIDLCGLVPSFFLTAFFLWMVLRASDFSANTDFRFFEVNVLACKVVARWGAVNAS